MGGDILLQILILLAGSVAVLTLVRRFALPPILGYTSSSAWSWARTPSGSHRTPRPCSCEPYVQLKKILREKKINTQSLHEGAPTQIINGVEIFVLNPPGWNGTQKKVQTLRDLNNSSVVLKLRFKNVSLLLAGDIGKEAEGRMLRKDVSLRADILKIPTPRKFLLEYATFSGKGKTDLCHSQCG